MASPDDLWLVDFGQPFPGEPAFHRPALVLGPPASFGSDFPYVILVPLTTSARGISLHVEIEPTRTTGLDDTSYAQCELLRSVNSQRLVHRLGAADPETGRQVRDIVGMLLNP